MKTSTLATGALSAGLAALVVCAGGCINLQLQQYSSLAASFQKTFSTASTVLSAEYTALSSIERKEYLDDAAYDPTIKIGTTQDGKPTALLQSHFTPEAFKARADAITAIGTFAQRIVDLAGDTSSQKLSANIAGLGTGISGLSGTFSKLAHAGGDASAGSYVGPISSLTADITKLYVGHIEITDIKTAVDSGAPTVGKILDLFESDLQNVVGPESTLATHDYLNNRLLYYNNLPATTSLADRKAALDEINAATTAYVAAKSFNPTQTMQALRDSLQKLQAYADNPHDPKTFADVVASLQAADQSLQDISQQAAKLETLINK